MAPMSRKKKIGRGRPKNDSGIQWDHSRFAERMAMWGTTTELIDTLEERGVSVSRSTIFRWRGQSDHPLEPSAEVAQVLSEIMCCRLSAFAKRKKKRAS